MKLDGSGPGEHLRDRRSLALPDVKPLPTPGSTLFYHFEVRDMKGQPAISDIYMIKVRPYEIAGAFPDPQADAPPSASAQPSLDLLVFIAAAWNIQAQKDPIEADDYNKRCDDLAATHGSAGRFAAALRETEAPSLVAPDKVPLIAKGDEMVKQGIATLRGHDAGKATEQFREAVALWTQCGVAFDMQDKVEDQRDRRAYGESDRSDEGRAGLPENGRAEDRTGIAEVRHHCFPATSARSSPKKPRTCATKRRTCRSANSSCWKKPRSWRC